MRQFIMVYKSDIALFYSCCKYACYRK